MKIRNRQFLVISVLLIACAGCSSILPVEQIMRLKGYSDEKNRLHRLVDQQNKKFESLLAAISSGTLQKYSDQKSIWKNFGEPVFSKQINMDSSVYTVWMYRYSTKLIGSEKVYLYFDPQGKLKSYDYSSGGNMTPIKTSKDNDN